MTSRSLSQPQDGHHRGYTSLRYKLGHTVRGLVLTRNVEKLVPKYC
jgi:hypothetical protein